MPARRNGRDLQVLISVRMLKNPGNVGICASQFGVNRVFTLLDSREDGGRTATRVECQIVISRFPGGSVGAHLSSGSLVIVVYFNCN